MGGGARLKLLVGLLLVLGAFPKQSEGLKCYDCKEDECTGTWDPCPDDRQYCSFFGGPGHPNKRDCSYTAMGDCWKKQFGLGCVTETDPTKIRDLNAKLQACFPSSAQPEPRNAQDSSPYSVCFCQSDLCNKDSTTATAGGGSGGDGSDGDDGSGDKVTAMPKDKDDSSTNLHPFNSIIMIAILLTVGFYTYL